MKPLLQVLGLWRRRWSWLALGLVVSLASVGAGVALLGLAGAHVALLVMGGALAVGALLQILGPARVLLRYLERLTTHAATFRALADLRVWFFRGLARQSAGGLGLRSSSDVAARMVSDVEALDGLYLRIIVPIAAGVLLLPVLAFVLIEGQTMWLGVGTVLLFVAAAFVVPALAARGAVSAGVRLVQASAALRITVVDVFAGLRDVRAFGAEDRVLAATQSRDDAVVSAQGVVARRASLAQAAGFLCGQAGLILVLLAAGARPVYAVGTLFLTVAAFEAVGGLPRAGALAGNAAAAARRVLDAASGEPAVPEPAVPAPLPSGHMVRFEGVTFRWAPDRPELFEGLTLDIPPGSRVAILGPSGVGKSTLAALLLKVVAPQSGRLLLGGTDIASLSSAAVRAQIGWLGQATHLFDDTIRANLLLGRPDADEAALWRALDTAEIGEFVRSLPDQLDTWLGEGGTRASGGQGRRIALARTLLTEAPILILDEPCAGLDAATERAFLTTLNAVPDGRTVLLIAHRLTGVERLDRIWRLSAGHAVAAAA
jgi:ATP-binding cassette, subfamily C, bacterial CydC